MHRNGLITSFTVFNREDSDLSLTGKGKYGLKPGELKFGNDKQIRLTTDSNVESYLLVTEFRRNN